MVIATKKFKSDLRRGNLFLLRVSSSQPDPHMKHLHRQLLGECYEQRGGAVPN